jgi:asparagine synthase (glutamine-hydrolysing)
MCGIAGAVALRADQRPDRETIQQMSCALAHRGPDGEGYWESPNGRAALAHRRLSVIDLATGQQPMLSTSGANALVFNGEIYNYRELRQDLEKAGAVFRTQSDTEVILQLYERHGDGCVDMLRGMFAFGLWDGARERMLMARDRIGKKPLYHTILNGSLFFSSSLASLRAAMPARPPLDVAAVDSFMSLGYIPAPRTIYTGVQKLEAGTVMVIERGEVTTRSFWSLAKQDAFTGSYEDAVDALDELLGTAVDIRLRSDVPLGVFLSGGIDSSLITAIAARRSTSKVRTFTIAIDDAAFDESGYAARVAEHLGTEHLAFKVRPDVLTLLPRYVHHFGEPFADSSAFPTWVLAEETRRFVTVALGGDGGDEGFAGYDWYRTAASLHRMGQMVPAGAASAGARAVAQVARWTGARSRRVGGVGRGLTMLAHGTDAARFAALRTFMAPSDATALYAGDLAAARAERGAVEAQRLADLYDQADGSTLRKMRYVDIRTYLADCQMPKVDVATMAHGLEARAPLLDQDVVRFALSLPDEYVMENGRGKRILRTLLRRYVPPALFEREKQGFTPPLAPWFAGSYRTALHELASSPALLEQGWFSARGITSLVDEHARGARDNSQRLFQLLVLNEWLKLS